jgi:hypothetical protein
MLTPPRLRDEAEAQYRKAFSAPGEQETTGMDVGWLVALSRRKEIPREAISKTDVVKLSQFLTIGGTFY